VTGVPGREAPRQRSGPVGAVVAELDGQPCSGRQALGLEVAVQIVEELERLGRFAAGQKQASQLGRGGGVPRVELERLSERLLIVRGGELVGGGRGDPVQELLDLWR